MKENKFTLQIPAEMVAAISRRHNGRPDITEEEARTAYAQMTLLHTMWESAKKHLDWVLDVFWEEEKIESRPFSPKWYGAHRRLRNAEEKVKELHKQMYYLLICTDGNYEPFGSDAIDAETIFIDFCDKYKKYL